VVEAMTEVDEEAELVADEVLLELVVVDVTELVVADEVVMVLELIVVNVTELVVVDVVDPVCELVVVLVDCVPGRGSV
jgi:hypothetical protein